MEIINRRKLYKMEAKRAKLEEERLAKQLGDDGNVSCSSKISEEEVKETEAGNIQSPCPNPTDAECKVTKLKCQTDKADSKHRSDYSGLFKVFGLLITFSSLGFFMIFK